MSNCIPCDKKFGRGKFEIGYYDRLLEKIVRVPFAKIICPDSSRKTIQIMNSEGEIYYVPLHRIQAVYKDGRLIWHL